jgi:lipopolysaccharide/colanic/teichoic acid biosynthesis glycosyltransferase
MPADQRARANQFGIGRAIAKLRGTEALPLWKRGIDLSCCLVALPLLAISTLLMAALTSLVSPGPIFFYQERVGHRGNRFRLYKLRTMHVSTRTECHENHFAHLAKSNRPMQKLDAAGDDRLIPGGWLLRATGLDELPQILNILRGDMSIVGPRPCIPYEYGVYTAHQRQRFESVPGLTGLWQVSGKNRTSFDEMVRLDIEYAQRRNVGLDLKIIVLTIPALCTQIADTGKARAALRKNGFRGNALRAPGREPSR